MRSFLLIIFCLIASYTFGSVCDITAQYRCRNGKAGNIVGRGDSVEAAKINARDRAREICSGMVDYGF